MQAKSGNDFGQNLIIAFQGEPALTAGVEGGGLRPAQGTGENDGTTTFGIDQD